MGRLANYILFIITTIVTIVTFASFVTSAPVKIWTKTHSAVIFYGLIFFFMATGASLNYFLEERKKYRRLKEVIAHMKPSENDKKLFQVFIAMLPPDGPTIEWLKENFVPNAFLRKDYEVIETVLRDMRLQPLQFDNSKVQAGYDELREAMQKFCKVALKHLRKDPGSPWLRMPPEWDSERSSEAADEINKISLELRREYDNFLDLAHQDRIDE